MSSRHWLLVAIKSLGRLSQSEEGSKVWKILVPARWWGRAENKQYMTTLICRLPSLKGERWRGFVFLVASAAYLATPELIASRDLEGVQSRQRPGAASSTPPLDEEGTGDDSAMAIFFCSLGIWRAGWTQLPGSETGRGVSALPSSHPLGSCQPRRCSQGASLTREAAGPGTVGVGH